MKLRTSFTTPYGRKARIVVIERGLEDRVEIVPTDPWAPDTDLPADNPLGKVPTLVLEDGTIFFDSGLVCEYLDAIAPGGPALFPAGPTKWAVQRLHMLAQGGMDASVARLLDTRRPAEQQSETWQNRQRATMGRVLDGLESWIGEFANDDLSIGTITAGCMLSYFDLRFAADDWRQGRSTLTAWFEEIRTRRSFVETEPPQA